MKKSKIIIIVIAIILVVLGIVFIPSLFKKDKKQSNEKICSNLVSILTPYITNKDTDGFIEKWDNREGFNTTSTCSKVECLCEDAWDLFLQNKINISDKYLEKGLVSSAYNSLGSTYIKNYKKINKYFNKKDIFKIIPSKEKEEITGVYHSFGIWKWEHKVGSSFKMNKRYVSFASSYMTLQFSDYFDKVLISGHLKPSKHTNWNPEKNVSVEWYNYKILDNTIYIKLENESESEYDKIFEITEIKDNSMKLKLLMNLEDVDAGQIYEFNYIQQ